MSRQLDGKSCQACHAYLFDDDDIVVCPDCGAPYHRGCYESLGKCALEESHGTENAYDAVLKREAAQTEEQKREKHICPSCGRMTAEKTPFCPYCGSSMEGKRSEDGRPPYMGAVPRFGVGFDPLGGINEKTEIENGITAKEAAIFVGPRSDRYVPRFLQNESVGWNFAAFLMPTAWFCYRKLYKWAAVTFIAFVAAVMLTLPLYSEISGILGRLPTDAALSYQAIAEAAQSASGSATAMSAVGMLITVASGVLSGLFGERAYRSHTVRTVSRIKQEYDGEEASYRIAKKGGVNLLLFMISVLVIINWEIIADILMDFFI